MSHCELCGADDVTIHPSDMPVPSSAAVATEHGGDQSPRHYVSKHVRACFDCIDEIPENPTQTQATFWWADHREQYLQHRHDDHENQAAKTVEHVEDMATDAYHDGDQPDDPYAF